MQGKYSPVYRKIMPLYEAKLFCMAAKCGGSKIALCNGCFDGILTPGHLSVFEHAASNADLVVAAVNSDESVARLKGPGRPVLASVIRRWMLASLHTVHVVVEQADDAPLGLVAVLGPDYLVKGSDTNLEDAIAPGIGPTALTGMGCKVLLAPEMPGPHSSEILAKSFG